MKAGERPHGRPLERPFPGIVWGEYPQRETPAAASGLAAAWRALQAAFAPRLAPYREFARRVEARMQAQGPLDGAAIANRLQALRGSLASGTTWQEVTLEDAFSLAGAAFESAMGLRPYTVQIIAARIMLDGRLAEMATGEGKTVAIALASGIAALGNTPVHVITANDYLAARDAQAMAPFFTALGLAAGVVTQPLSQAQRRQAWGRSVTYCTAKELVFDYLRDGMARPRGLADLERRALRLADVERRAQGLAGAGTAQQPLLRGLCMAIVDEADTVLIDEANVPLVLSQSRPDGMEPAFLAQADTQAAALREGADFMLPPAGGVALTDAGRERLAAAWPPAPPGTPGSRAIHNDRRHREDAVQLALTARYLLLRDRDYVVRDGQVTIIDATTGRTSPGRAWSRGLHQLVELKEGCAFTGRNSTVSQITFQRFFPRYLRLAGMSGTLAGSAGEMNAVYGLRTVRVPTRLPSRRREERLRLYPDSPALWQAVARRVGEVHATGRPVLVGTGSVAESERLSAVLDAAGLTHAVLNARRGSAAKPVEGAAQGSAEETAEEGERAIVAAAGQRGRITVATSMAGRGTDIQLGEGVAALGGLHVILCQHNASRRIDRQFIGRAGRRGEPGSIQVMLALDFPLFARWLPRTWREAAAKRAISGRVPALAAHVTACWPQWLASYTQQKQRQSLCRADEETERSLAFNRETFS